MNNTESRILFGISGEIVSFPSKLGVNSEQTPIKRPFKDTTNKSSDLHQKAIDNDLQWSAVKIKNTEKKFDKMHYIDELKGFNFPSDKNCFCCGNDRSELCFEKAYAFHHLCDSMYRNYRVPEEQAFDINDKDNLDFLPINCDEYDTSSSTTTFWTNFCKIEEENDDDYYNKDLRNNSSILSIPELIDDSYDSIESSW
ncbi:hypothetical protein PVAND_006604 [Polypedilum vanderplanki]|uniref:Uncharacterized protein n=1 Tax=Polypedilum vanderplanki TaxID=319348 RepID=A0A9J6C3Q4_POLVA|nr:hypothetical protein PVAND_006604 [Polypedilum vanderplanki]